MVGWNIEIMFMFTLVGIIFYHTLTEDRKVKILGLPEMWFWAIGYWSSASSWKACSTSAATWSGSIPSGSSLKGVPLIFLIG